jgi:hypothetical protein
MIQFIRDVKAEFERVLGQLGGCYFEVITQWKLRKQFRYQDPILKFDTSILA